MPSDVIQHISQLKAQGAKIIKGDNTEAMAKAANPEMMRKTIWTEADTTQQQVRSSLLHRQPHRPRYQGPSAYCYRRERCAVVQSYERILPCCCDKRTRRTGHQPQKWRKQNPPQCTERVGTPLQDKKLRPAKTEPQTIDKGESIDLTANTGSTPSLRKHPR